MMRRLATFLTLSIVAAFSGHLRAAGAVTEDVPVPGGTVAMARALGIEPSPDRARFVAELARLTHQASEDHYTTKTKAASLLQRERASRALPRSPGGAAESVPLPLTVAMWSKAVFHRPIAPDQIVSTIMADPRAAHLCYGLASLDDETLQFFVDHPADITRLYERAAAAFAVAGSSLHVRQNRVVLAGGDAAADVWTAVIGERPERPGPFVHALFGQDDGRLAYLFDAIGELDAPRAAFALGLWIKDPAVRIKRFKALVAINRTAIPQWQPGKLPFTRPLYDIASTLARVQVEPDGSPSAPSLRSEWAWIFESSELLGGPPRASAPDDGPIDAAWLTQMIVSLDTRERGERIDQLTFGQRVFGHVNADDHASALVAIRVFPRFRMLLLTLERSGVRHPAVYLSAARRAQQLSSLDRRRLFVTLGQFQGALALIARMSSVHTLDAAATESLVASLASVSPNTDGRYGGAIAAWLQRSLRPAIAGRLKTTRRSDVASAAALDPDMETVVLQAVAGVSRRPAKASAVEWEGDVYRLDIAASEERRLRRIREKQGGPSIDEALAPGKEDVLADVLMAWTYAVSIADAGSPLLLTAAATRRHNFGLGSAEHGPRLRTAWALPRQDIAVGIPWHVTGSLLGLDVALSALSLRRIGGDRAIEAPTLSSNERDAFAVAVALLNPFDLHDPDRDDIAAAVERGRRRVAALAGERARLDEVASEIHMDGWRQRAVKWTLVNEPDRVGSFFSMTELLFLGQGIAGDFSAWGTSALASAGCFCTRLPSPNQWRWLVGRPQLGLMASAVADLNLHVAVVLRTLRLPAAVAKSVLSAAVQDFIDEARPTDFNDWLTLVRTAQAVPRERIEDYVAVATADGPLVPFGQ
jgi:hypothetical protein